MLDLLIDLLAVYRLTRLVTTDVFPPILAVRGWILRRWPDEETQFGDSEVQVIEELDQAVVGKVPVVPYKMGWWVAARPHWLGELITCPWCASVWLAGAVALVRDFTIWRWLAFVLAASAVAGLLATWEKSPK